MLVEWRGHLRGVGGNWNPICCSQIHFNFLPSTVAGTLKRLPHTLASIYAPMSHLVKLSLPDYIFYRSLYHILIFEKLTKKSINKFQDPTKNCVSITVHWQGKHPMPQDHKRPHPLHLNILSIFSLVIEMKRVKLYQYG